MCVGSRVKLLHLKKHMCVFVCVVVTMVTHRPPPCRRRSWTGRTATSVRVVRVNRTPPEGSNCTAFLQPSTCSSCALSLIGQLSLCTVLCKRRSINRTDYITLARPYTPLIKALFDNKTQERQFLYTKLSSDAITVYFLLV